MAKSKYSAIRTTVDGVTFDSKKEAARYIELTLMVRAKAISDLELQPVFPMTAHGVPIGKYRGDFRYRDLKTGAIVIEDVKGMRTPVYRLKRKIVEAEYGIEIREV